MTTDGVAGMKRMNHMKQGFSLVEVNLAIFVVAAGLLVIFSLFPMGLKESELSMEDTQEAMFAEYVLGTMEGNAMLITDPTVWQGAAFNAAVMQEIGFTLTVWNHITDPDTLLPQKFPPSNTDELYMKYILTITNYPNSTSWDRKKVQLTLKSGKYGRVADGRVYITELVFTGM
jgi:hypothetical protein